MDCIGQKLGLGFLLFFLQSLVFAATPVNLLHHSLVMLQAEPGITMQETSRVTDNQNMLHIRMQEMYQGYAVFGAEAILHITGKSTSMNGMLYQNLHADLAGVNALVLNTSAQKALQYGIHYYLQQLKYSVIITEKNSQLIVFIDDANKAHWAYQIHFRSEAAGLKPVEQVYILDATTFALYASWDDVPTMDIVDAGGFGGNPRMGQRIYDGLSNHLPKLTISRDNATKICYLQNQEITIRSYGKKNVLAFACPSVDVNHNNVYWDAMFDTENQGYSPGNDALFAAQSVKKMYDDLHVNLPFNFLIHMPYYDGALWDRATQTMVCGDGYKKYYPLTSVDVIAHELSHGVTFQYSKLYYFRQSGAINESFSDIAAQAALVSAYGENDWQIGSSITKVMGKAIRYLDRPSKDCEGKEPGNMCSIDNANQYHDNLDIHFGSGVYNRFFYLLATTPGWDVGKAFQVMLHANQYYWTENSTYITGACGVIHAANQLGFDTNAVKHAFDKVGVNYKIC